MISPEVRSALKQLHEQITPNAPEGAGDCWAEFIGAVIEITRQNTGAETLKPAPKRRFFTKDDIIVRAFREMDFDLEDFGLQAQEE
jgi:hypothetical protein